ncbi:hypothetical protein J3P89_16275 [Pseudomonas sp. Z1-14]|uniref:hypothetical protein n=1 Tax=Pseudomonas sp. Z1-14 TaxID=2817409 RepID=UPI003DA8B0A7
MAILRMFNGDVYADIDSINRIIGPMEIGQFNVDSAFLREVRSWSSPIRQDQAERVLKSLDADTEAALVGGGFDHRRVGNLVANDNGGFSMCVRFLGGDADAPVAELSKETIQNYLTPHHLLVNNIHFLFAGLIAKGLQLKNGQQCVVYLSPGEYMRLNHEVFNWPIFSQGAGTVAVSCYDLPVEEHKFDLHPELTVPTEMRF